MANSIFYSLLWVLLSWLCPAYQAGIVKKALLGQQVNLTCQTNSTEDITWQYFGSPGSYHAYGSISCPYSSSLKSQCKSDTDDLDFQGTRSKETSSILLTAAHGKQIIQCLVGNHLVRRYNLISIDPSDTVPNCTVTLPSSDENGVLSMELSCGVNSFGVNVSLTFEGIGLDIPDTPRSFQNIRTKSLHFDDITSIHNASCNAYIPGYNIIRSCNYPNIVKTQYIVDVNDVIVECDAELDVDWHLFDSDGREEDINNRSWTREGGRSLLIRNVSEQDVGKVVVCQPRGDNFSNGTIMFTVISEISRGTNEANSGDSQPVPDDSSVFFVPTLLFLLLWSITTIGGVLMGCKKSQKIPNNLVISDNEEIKTAPEYDTVIHNMSGRNDLDDDRSVSLGSLGGGSRRMMAEESKAHYMDMDGNHASTDYQTMKSLTYENNILSAGTTGSSGAEDERVTGGTHYVDMSGKNGQNDYEAMKSFTYNNL